MKAYDIAIIPGDGVGPEITEATRRVIEATGVAIEWEEAIAGEAVFRAGDSSGVPQETADSIARTGVALKGPLATPIVLLGTWAEFILPALIVIGLFTRIAALGMIGFVTVQSLTDIHGHHADATTIGAWFDRASDSLIMDQRAFWMLLLITLVLRGAGPLSIDRLIGIGQPHKQ